jgi:hypothetical protein
VPRSRRGVPDDADCGADRAATLHITGCHPAADIPGFECGADRVGYGLVLTRVANKNVGWGVSNNTNPETLAMISGIASHSNIIIPDSAGMVTVLAGRQVPSPVHPPPPAPSYILRRSKLVGPTYTRNVSAWLR